MPVNSFADKWVKKIFGSSSQIFLKSAKPIVAEINALEPEIEKLTDDELKAQTDKFRVRIKKALADFDESDEGQEQESTVWRGAGVSPEAKSLLERRRKAEQEILHEILPEAFATVREASRRVLGMRHFDVQLIGGLALHQGRIAEMRTGEG